MRRPGLAAGVLALALLTGCAPSVAPLERLGEKAAQRVRAHGPTGTAAPPYRRWGLPEPLAHPPSPAHAPTVRRARPLTVVRRVPTRDKVVFLTYDDGAEQDPRFVDMVRELRLPVSMFLTGRGAGPGHGHFALRGLPYAGQRAEICGRQARHRSRFGVRPRLFRPPHGAYDTTTLRAAADCGVSAVVLWRASMEARQPTFARGEPRLRPGDIVSVPSGEPASPTLVERTRGLLRAVEGRGLTVGRLEDYL
ncbi:polysaccharide deacetylase family protein [Streptomyces sp. NPDC101209]|uniref:polysaccharide deacetylase family protein n=1 Tax=Streptomyces sp. NPDC101209 TaxID=3366129 RepID=UPI00381622E8